MTIIKFESGTSSSAGAPRGQAPSQTVPLQYGEREALKQALWLASELAVNRYLMSCADGRWNGAEKAERHDELCRLYVAVFRGVHTDKVRETHALDWSLVHDATQVLTDSMDDEIGFPITGMPDYDALAPKFFERFHTLATDALIVARATPEALATDGHVQPVPHKCDRIHAAAGGVAAGGVPRGWRIERESHNVLALHREGTAQPYRFGIGEIAYALLKDLLGGCPECGGRMEYEDGEPWSGPSVGCVDCGVVTAPQPPASAAFRGRVEGHGEQSMPVGSPAGSGGWRHHAEAMERERDHWRQRAQTMHEHQAGQAWYWQSDGGNHLESLVNSLPVVIRADQLRAMLAAATSQPAHRPASAVRAAPPSYEHVSVASACPPSYDHHSGEPDPLMAEAEEAVRSSGKPSISYLQRKLRIGYNRTSRLLESLEKLGVVSTMDARGVRVVLERKP